MRSMFRSPPRWLSSSKRPLPKSNSERSGAHVGALGTQNQRFRYQAPTLPGKNIARSRRADFAEKLGNLATELLALRFQRFGGALDVFGRGSSGIRIGFDTGDVVGDVLGAMRGKLRAARDFLGRRALLLHCGSDCNRDLVDLADNASDGLDGVDGLAGDLLDVGDLFRDFLGRLGGLARQRFYLGGDHGKAAAGLAGARRFNGGVQRQQIGLGRDGVDEADDLADPAS